MLLAEVSDQAIITAVAAQLNLTADFVEIVSEIIVSNNSDVASVLVEFKILAPARDYPTVGQHFSSYEACFDFFSDAMYHAVTSGAIYNQLLVVAEDLSAHELYSITAVNIISFEYQGAINTAVNQDDEAKQLSTDELVGVVIGVVVSFLLLAVLLYWFLCVVRKRNQAVQTTTAGTGSGGKGQEEV